MKIMSQNMLKKTLMFFFSSQPALKSEYLRQKRIPTGDKETRGIYDFLILLLDTRI